MKKVLLLLLLLCATMAMRAEDEGVVTLTTDAAVGTSVNLVAYCSTTDQAFKVDWGDGTVKSYNVDPNGWGYTQRISETVKGDTITITGPLVKLQLTEASLTGATFKNQSLLKDVDLSDNKLTSVTFDASMTALEDLDLSDNKLTGLTFPAMPALTDLTLSNNEIDSHDLDISQLASTLEVLKLANNKLVTLNLMAFGKLEQFYAPGNPDLTTVVFADGNANLRSINMANCHIMHFYGISLPSLSELILSNNALLSFTEGDSEHNYPKLSSFSVSNNYLTELDVTKYPQLYSLYCNGNQLTDLNVSALTELTTLNCSKNKLKALDLSQNTSLTTLYCDSNSIAKLDVYNLKKISTLSVSGNPLTSLDLRNAYYLREFSAADTYCSSFYFNYVNAWGQFRKVDVRNNKNMTAASLNFMFKTMPTYGGSSYNTSTCLFIAGSNGEHSDPSYVTSSDMNWIIDVKGDATATNDDVAVTVDATDTGEDITVTGQYGGMTADQTFTFTKWATTNGTFTLSQWTGSYYQQLADVTTTAKTGVQIMVTPTPAEGYKFKSVTVNGTEITDTVFIISAASTIKVNFTAEEKAISFTTGNGQALSFAIAAAKSNTAVAVDWGNGAKQETTIGTGWTRLDGTSTGTTVTIYGDVTRANFESYGEFGEEFGLWNNKITGIDVSKNTGLTELNLYMNPIKTVDVSTQSQLEDFDCSYCELTALDVTNNTALTTLKCYGNELTTLDVSHNTLLTSLNARVNQLSSIDLSANTALTELDLNNNQLPSIDLKALTSLQTLKLQNNQLASIDLSKNTRLTEATLGLNKLTAIDLSANKLLQVLSFNDNGIKDADLSMLPYLRSIDCGGNGMDACDMDDFYNQLPQRYTGADGDENPGVTLTVLTGTETTPNEASGADGAIATAKGWTLNIAGNASGCDLAYIIIKQSAHGTIKLIDASKVEIVSGDKTKKNSPITVEATPDEGCELSALKANGISVDTKSFEITRMTEVVPEFTEQSSVTDVAQAAVRVTGKDGRVMVAVSGESQVGVFTVQGACVFSGNTASAVAVPVGTGTYLVRVATPTGTVTKKIVVE